jgi:TolB-like protein/DNA-binding winged helix-turn-helix (wHTH) protein/Tfp pilus assembly protein PilF
VAGSSTVVSTWKFGAFELDTRAGELRKDGVAVKLQPQQFKVLALLVERAGELVPRDELKRALWGEETYVDFERGLNFCINQVRAALGDAAESPQFIQTVPRRGYRFVAEVRPFRVDSEPTPNRFRVDSEPVPSEVTSRLKVGWQFTTIGVAFLATLIAAATFLAGRVTPPPATSRSRTMIAVLPLDDLSGDASSTWFADGLTEELIAQLGRVSPQRLGVIARTSAMAYRGSNKTVAEIGRELDVSHVLEGSIRRDGSRVRVTVQLVDVSDQSPVWSETYDRTVHGALTIQSEVAAQATRALAIELLPAPFTAPAWAATQTPAARDAYLRGRYFVTRGAPGDTRTAIENFEEAVRLDSRFARGHAALAAAYHWLAMSGQSPPRDAYSRAAAAAREALRLDPNLAEAHDAMGLVQLWSEWDPTAAAASFTRAISLNPSHATAHHDLAWSLVALQRFDEAVAHITRARELDPLSPRASNDIGWLYLHIRQPSEAARACRQTLSFDPDSIEAQQCLERAHLQRGELNEALRAARTAFERGGAAVPAVLENSGPPAARLEALWRWRLQRLETLERERPVNPYTLAMHHIVLGEDQAALTRLEQAYEVRASVMVLLPGDPLFERLRATPRFVRLVERIRQRAD